MMHLARRTTLLLILLALWFPAREAWAATDISVDPVEAVATLNPGAKQEFTFTIRNFKAQQRVIELSCAELSPAGERFLHTPNGEGCAWLTLDETSLTLPAYGEQSLIVQLSPSIDASAELATLLVELREAGDTTDTVLAVPIKVAWAGVSAAGGTEPTGQLLDIETPTIAWRLPIPVQFTYQHTGPSPATVAVSGTVTNGIEQTVELVKTEAASVNSGETIVLETTVVAPKRPADAWLSPIDHYTVTAVSPGIASSVTAARHVWAIPLGTLGILILVSVIVGLLVHRLTHTLGRWVRAHHLVRWEGTSVEVAGSGAAAAGFFQLASLVLRVAGIRLLAAPLSLIVRQFASLIVGVVAAASIDLVAFQQQPPATGEVVIRASVSAWTLYQKRIVGDALILSFNWNHAAGVLVLEGEQSTIDPSSESFTRLAAFPRGEGGQGTITSRADRTVLLLSNIDELDANSE